MNRTEITRLSGTALFLWLSIVHSTCAASILNRYILLDCFALCKCMFFNHAEAL